MEKTIKYLENGEYHYATVKDVGDLAKLKTDSKEDLVSAINDLFSNGGAHAGKPEGYDKLVEELTKAISDQQDIKNKLDDLDNKDTSEDADRKKEIEELRQQQADARAKADAAYNKLAKEVEDQFNALSEEQQNISKQIKQDSDDLHSDLEATKADLEKQKTDLASRADQIDTIDQKLQETTTQVTNNKNLIGQTATKKDLDLVSQTVEQQKTEIKQQSDELLLKASKSDLDGISKKVESNSAQIKVANDNISAITEQQKELKNGQQSLKTEVDQNASGIKQVSTDLQTNDKKIQEFEGKIQSTAHDLTTSYQKYTNNAIGQISDSGLNKILNSSFMIGDDHLSSWQNISPKVTMQEDGNGLMWARLIQSNQDALSNPNPIGLTSNYFSITQGKVTVAVDVKLGTSVSLNNENILRVELYDNNKKRVDFHDYSIENLQLNRSLLADGKPCRGIVRVNIDRNDVSLMTVKLVLNNNGDISFTNVSARLSSIDNGDYSPNPDDFDKSIIKLNTSIEQNAKDIKLKASSAEVDNKVQGITEGLDNKMSAIAKSEVDLASDKFQVQVEKVTKTLDTNPNLYPGTADFSGNSWDTNHFDEWTDDGWTDPEGNEVRTITGKAWSGIGQLMYLGEGDYTFSAWVWLSGANDTASAMLFAGTGYAGETGEIDNDKGQGPYYLFNSDNDKWNRITWTFHVKKSGKLKVRLELEQDTGTIHIGSLKLEKGKVATKWTHSARELVTVNKVISSINASPESIKLASNKIILDGDTTIKDTLNVGNVNIKGQGGAMKFSSEGISLGNDKFDVTLKADSMDFNTKGNDKLSIGLSGFNNVGPDYSTTINYGKITTNQLDVTGGAIRGTEIQNTDTSYKIMGDYKFTENDKIQIGHRSPTFSVFKNGEISLGAAFWRSDEMDKISNQNVFDYDFADQKDRMIGSPEAHNDRYSLLPITKINNIQNVQSLRVLFQTYAQDGLGSSSRFSGMLVAWNINDNNVHTVSDTQYGNRLEAEKTILSIAELGFLTTTGKMAPLTPLKQVRTETIDFSKFNNGSTVCLGLLVKNPVFSLLDEPGRSTNFYIYLTLKDYNFNKINGIDSSNVSRNLWAISRLNYGYLLGEEGNSQPVPSGTVWHTDYIPTGNNKYLTVTQYKATDSPTGNHDESEFYDANKTWIANGPTLSTNADNPNFTKTIPIPENAAYVRISMPWVKQGKSAKDGIGVFKWEFGDKATPWTPAPEDMSAYSNSTALDIDPGGMLSFKSQHFDSVGGFDTTQNSISFNEKGELELLYNSAGEGKGDSEGYTVNNYGTKMNGSQIAFSADPTTAGSNMRLVFNGQDNNSGISFDSYGNIHAAPGGWAWKIKEANGSEAFAMPVNTDGDFVFNSNGHNRSYWFHLNPVDNGNVTFNIQRNDRIGFYVGHGNKGNVIDITALGGINFHGGIHVSGAKNSVVNTSQGALAINAYETAEYYFGDIGESNTGKDGKIIIGIDQVFKETVNTDIPYQVFVTPYSNAKIWVSKREKNRFVVESDVPNAEFAWEIKAKRIGYENTRLKRLSGNWKPQEVTIAEGGQS